MDSIELDKIFYIICILFFLESMNAQNDTLNRKDDSVKVRTPVMLSKKGMFRDTKKRINEDSKRVSMLSNKNLIDTNRISSSQLILKPDSVGHTRIKDFKGDSTETITRRDSVTKRKFLKNIRKAIPHGTLNFAWDYGFLPYTVNTSLPVSAIKTEGQIETDFFNIPVDVTYFYSTQKTLIGLTNYFRISYNADRYKNKLSTKLNENIDVYKSHLGNMNSQKQTLMQKMVYTDYLSSITPDKWPVDIPENKNDSNVISIKGSIGNTKPDFIEPDTNSVGSYRNGDTLKNNVHYSRADSLRQQAIIHKNKSDSVKQVYREYKKQYDVLTDSIKEVQTKISTLETITNSGSYSVKSPYLNKVQNFLSGVKKMDIGLCYPGYSTFLANNIPVRGINFEYEKDHRFFAFTYGTTVSTVLYPNGSMEGFLQNVRNSYNYLDVNDLSAGRKILSAKFGLGKNNGEHFYLGFLLGKGINRSLPQIKEQPVSGLTESNLVLEADIRKNFNSNNILEIIVGKSSVQNNDLNLTALEVSAKELFSKYRSNAMLTKLKTYIPITRSNVTFSVRWIDPFFNSFGIGFMRSDNMRYEVKLDQPLRKLFRYTVMFRYEEDNLLMLLRYKNTFYSVNNTVTYKIKKGLTLRLSYTPLLRTLNSDNYRLKSKSSIMTGILTFTPKGKNTQKQFSLLYNSYQIDTDSIPVSFQNLTYYHQVTFKKRFRTGLNISWFKNNIKDSIGNNIFLAVLDIGYQFKNNSTISIAGKSAYKSNDGFYPGYILKSTTKLTAVLFWENQIEKFIVGDLFNGYDLQSLEKFPYCFSTKLILNF